MKPELQALTDSQPAWAWLFGGALLAIILFFVILPFLQRRFRIFTRGTIAFMVSALMIFTLVDGIEHLNEIRNSEGRIRLQARANTVGSLLQSYFKGGPEAAIEQIPFEAHRDALSESLRSLEAELGKELLDRNSPVESPRELRLVSLDVGRDLVGRMRRLNPSHYRRNAEDWGFVAILDDDENFQRVEGLVRVSRETGDTITVLDVRGKLAKTMARDDLSVVRYFQRARTFTNEDYSTSRRMGQFQLTRASPR